MLIDIRPLTGTGVALVILLRTGCSKSPADEYFEYIDSGLAFAEAGGHDSAVIQFRNAARIDTSKAEPLYQLAPSSFALGHRAVARAGVSTS